MNMKMPVLFVGHGSPMNAINEDRFTDGFKKIAEILPKPKAVICISAHWETSELAVTAMEHPKTIHDFGGFPKALYEQKYPAPGSPGLADEIAKTIKMFPVVKDEFEWGLDHGTWTVMKYLFPEADVPIVQLSLDHFLTPQQHYDVAKQLSPFREKGVMVIGSGNMIHNLRILDWNHINVDYAYSWTKDVAQDMERAILTDNHKALISFPDRGGDFRFAIPTKEHYLPLLYAVALKEENDKITLFNEGFLGGSLSMTSVLIG